MIVGTITELRLEGAFDRGVPNLERVVITANELVNMGQFGVLLGIRAEHGMAKPIRDNFYWFGDGLVRKGDWIFLYTGPGETRTVEVPNTTEKIYSVHWGRGTTVLDHSEIVPILFRLDAVDIVEQRLQIENQPQS